MQVTILLHMTSTQYSNAMDELNMFVLIGKNEHDDAPDALTGVYENPKPLGKWMV